MPTAAEGWSTSLARAVAAVGAFDDGRRDSLNDLAPEEAAQIDQARLLLAAQPRRPAPGLPFRLPGGGTMQMPADVIAGRDAKPLNELPPAIDTGARIVDGALVPRRFTANGKLPVPISGDRLKDLTEPDAWIAVPYNPALVGGEPLQITNRSGSDYAVSLEADDFGGVRLNGGLVVPGRFYRLDGTITVTATVPVGVIIRPIGVLHGVYDQPVRPPSANG